MAGYSTPIRFCILLRERAISNRASPIKDNRLTVVASSSCSQASGIATRPIRKPVGSKIGSSIAESLLIERGRRDYFDRNDRFCGSVSYLIYFSVLSAAMLLREDTRQGIKPCFPPWACTFSPSSRVRLDYTGTCVDILTKESSRPNCSS